MCNSRKILQDAVPLCLHWSDSQGGAFHNLYRFYVSPHWYFLKDLAADSSPLPWLGGGKYLLQCPLFVLCTMSRPPRWLTPEVRSDVLFGENPRIPAALSILSISERELSPFWPWRAENAGGSVSSGTSFLATLSEESILFIADGWAAEEWLATPTIIALVVHWGWDIKSR